MPTNEEIVAASAFDETTKKYTCAQCAGVYINLQRHLSSRAKPCGTLMNDEDAKSDSPTPPWTAYDPKNVPCDVESLKAALEAVYSLLEQEHKAKVSLVEREIMASQTHRKWQTENTDKTREYSRKWKERNREKNIECARKWREKQKHNAAQYLAIQATQTHQQSV
jgi:hypothetical protein